MIKVISEHPSRGPLRAMAVVGVAAISLSACGAASGSAAGVKKSTANSNVTSKASNATNSKVRDVVWWNMWSGSTVTILDKMVSEFNSTHPNIHVTQLNVPSSDGDAKLLSAIAGGDPPDVFTEFNPVIGEEANDGAIQPMNRFLTGSYGGLEKWMYPAALKGGMYNNKLVAVPMSMNTNALYYNKAMLRAAGISRPPTTLAQLDSDQAKEWKFSGGRLEQIGFYPFNATWQQFTPYFKVKDYVNGRYNLANNRHALAEMDWMASYSKYPYSDVSALNSALGAVSGASEDPFSMGKEGFELSGAYEGASRIALNPAMKNNFGVVPFPSVPGGATVPTTYENGNYNVIPKGATHPRAAFTFIAWLAGYNNPGIATYYPAGGWMPAASTVANTPAFANWESKAPYVRVFVSLLHDSGDLETTLTPTESEYELATTTALQDVATKKLTPKQALVYIDTQANKS